MHQARLLQTLWAPDIRHLSPRLNRWDIGGSIGLKECYVVLFMESAENYGEEESVGKLRNGWQKRGKVFVIKS